MAVVKRGRGLAPKRLGRYELLAELGSGGMAEVFLARMMGPADFHKWIAIKRVHPHMAKHPQFIDMFLDEARIAASIQHPNVASVFDLGDDDGEYFLAMEYLHGENLAVVMQRAAEEVGRVPYALATYIIARAAEGLHHSHQTKDRRGRPIDLIHRDVSPQNIFVTYDGQIKLTDFGIAKAAGRLTDTKTGGMKGKSAYMAPEQALGQDIDRRVDIFSLGVVLWELTVGQRLFKAKTEAQSLMRITGGNTPTPSSVLPGYPPALEAIVMRALNRDRLKRYESAGQMGDDLTRLLQSTGDHIGSREVSAFMRELLDDQYMMKEALLHSDPTKETNISDLRAPEEQSPVSESRVQVRTIPRSETPIQQAETSPTSSRRWLLLAALVVVLAVVGGVFFAARETAPLPSSARIATSPSGARVELNGESIEGYTPLTVQSLGPGRHSLSLSLDGFETLDRTFDVVPGETTELSYALSPEQLDFPSFDVDPTAPDTAAPALPEHDGTTNNEAAPNSSPNPSARTSPSERIARPPSRAQGEANLAIVSLPWSRVRVGRRPPTETPTTLTVPAGRVVLRYQVGGEGEERRMLVNVRAGEDQTVRLPTR